MFLNSQLNLIKLLMKNIWKIMKNIFNNSKEMSQMMDKSVMKTKKKIEGNLNKKSFF